MRDSKITTILSLCFSGPGNPYDVCAAVRKEHKKFYKCKSEQAKEKWHPRRMALARLGVFFGNKALSLPNPPVDVTQVVSSSSLCISRISICD